MAKGDSIRPNLLERAIAFAAPQLAVERFVARQKLVQFGWDGAQRGTNRGYSGGVAKNASSESSRMTRDRIELMWEARDLERNMPVIGCAFDRTVQYTLPNISYKPRTEDPEADYEYQVYLDNWFERECDLTGRHDFQALAELIFRAALRDGDHGVNNVVDEGPFVRLQTIEGDRIGDPTRAATSYNRADRVHGIQLDEVGRPLVYEIFNRTPEGTYTPAMEVPADQLTFLFNPFRTDQYRGVTWIERIIPIARDLYETFSFERGAIKWAAAHAGVIQSADQRMGKGGPGDAAGWDGDRKTEDGTPAVAIKPNTLLRTRSNEQVTFFPGVNRPSGAFMDYIDASLMQCAMGLNVPFGFFDMRQFNGVVSRLEVQQWQRTCQRFQRCFISRFLNVTRDRVLSHAIARGDIRPTRRWRWGVWRFGQHITADVGYETQSDLNMYLHGMMTGEDLAAKYGEDFEDMTERKAKEVLFYYDLSTRTGIPMELLAPQAFPRASELLAAVNAAGEPEVPPPPTIDTIGDKAATKLVEIQQQVAQGMLPREEAVAMLINVWNMDPQVAEDITPEPNARAMRQARSLNGGKNGSNGNGRNRLAGKR